MNKVTNALDIELHESAETKTLELVNDFAINLIIEAKRLAFQDNADVVLNNHVEDALDVLNSKRTISLTKQLAQVVGGAFFGHLCRVSSQSYQPAIRR